MADRLRRKRRAPGTDWRIVLLTVLVSLGVSMTLFALLVSGPREEATRPEALDGSAAPISADLAAQAGRSLSRPAAPPPPYRLAPPYDIVDGATFRSEKSRRTRLSGIEVPPRDGICFDAAGQMWACGLQARAALHGLVREREIACDPVSPESEGVIEARCRIERDDLAQSMIALGFARASDRAAPIQRNEKQARDQNRGVWNGGWRLR